MNESTTPDPGAQAQADVQQAHQAHAVPLWLLAGVFGILLVLTVLTVAATWVDLGPLNVWIALAIAVVKAGFVALYFMHLRWDSPFNGLILVVALLFVALLIGISLMDSFEYRRNYEPPVEAPTGIG